MKEQKRGTGISTRQMRECQKDSVFVVHSTPQISYFEAIKRKIGRSDIEIVTIGQLAGGWHIGRRYPEIVLDHYAAENMLPSDKPHVADAMAMAVGKKLSNSYCNPKRT